MGGAASYALGARGGERDDGLHRLCIGRAPDAKADKRRAEGGILPCIDPGFLAGIEVPDLQSSGGPEERDPIVELLVGIDRPAPEADLEIAGFVLHILDREDDAILILGGGGEHAVTGG